MFNKLFEMSVTLKKHNIKLTKKTKKLMKDQEAESKLASESKMIELEMYKLNSISTIVFLKEDNKNLINGRDPVLKRNKDFLDSNTKLETIVSNLMFELDKTNLSL